MPHGDLRGEVSEAALQGQVDRSPALPVHREQLLEAQLPEQPTHLMFPVHRCHMKGCGVVEIVSEVVCFVTQQILHHIHRATTASLIPAKE